MIVLYYALAFVVARYRWYLLGHKQVTEGLLAGINLVELVVIVFLVMLGLLRWFSHATFVLFYAVLLGYCMFSSLVTLLQINMACDKQAQATHHAKMECHMLKKLEKEDLDFLNDLLGELTRWDKPATLFGIPITKQTLFLLRAYAVAGVGAGVKMLTA